MNPVPDQPRTPWTPPHVHDLAGVRDALAGGVFTVPDGSQLFTSPV